MTRGYSETSIGFLVVSRPIMYDYKFISATTQHFNNWQHTTIIIDTWRSNARSLKSISQSWLNVIKIISMRIFQYFSEFNVFVSFLSPFRIRESLADYRSYIRNVLRGPRAIQNRQFWDPQFLSRRHLTSVTQDANAKNKF